MKDEYNGYTTELAMECFVAGANQCKTEDDLADFTQMLCIISAKTIHGLRGKEFQKDFLERAIVDQEKITPILKQ